MTSVSLKKRLARLTRPLRTTLSSNAEPAPRKSAIVNQPRGSAMSPQAVSTLESEIRRLSEGWNQHMPQLLATASHAHLKASQAMRELERVDELEKSIAALQADLKELKASLGISNRIPSHYNQSGEAQSAQIHIDPTEPVDDVTTDSLVTKHN